MVRCEVMRRTVSLSVEIHICTIQPYDQASDVHLGVVSSLSNLIPVSSRLIPFPERGHSLRNSSISTGSLKELVVRSVDSESAIARGIWGTFGERLRTRTDKATRGQLGVGSTPGMEIALRRSSDRSFRAGARSLLREVHSSLYRDTASS